MLRTVGDVIPRARLVAHGDLDTTNYSSFKTYAAVASLDSIHLVLSITVEYKLNLWSFNITTAFLYGKLNRDDLYLRIPQGLYLDPNEYACRLNKAMYGLKIASHQWEDRFSNDLIDLGLNRSIADRCMYYGVKNNSITILVTHVDDVLLATNDKEYLKKLFARLQEQYKMKIVENPSNFIGLQLDQSPDSDYLAIHQHDYIKRMAKSFDFDNGKFTRTPMEYHLNLSVDKDGTKNPLFRKIIGALLYVAQYSRPNIYYPVNKLACHQGYITPTIMSYARRIGRYLWRGVPEITL